MITPQHLMMLIRLAAAIGIMEGATAPRRASSPSPSPWEWPSLQPQVESKAEPARHIPLPREVEAWKRKAVRRYAQAQDRKWQKWVEAVFVRRPEPVEGERPR